MKTRVDGDAVDPQIPARRSEAKLPSMTSRSREDRLFVQRICRLINELGENQRICGRINKSGGTKN